MPFATLNDARRVKAAAREIAERAGEVAGVGVGKDGADYTVKVNFRAPPNPSAFLPDSLEGVPIVYEVVGNIFAFLKR